MESKILEVLRQIQDPVSHMDIVSAGMVQNIKTQGKNVEFTLQINPKTPADKRNALYKSASTVVGNLEDVHTVNVILTAERTDVSKGYSDIKHIIAVASGKGGVGKSTTSTNIALAMQKLGLSVGIMDADVFGPSQPRMLGITEKPDTSSGAVLPPLEGYGVKAMSIGFLVEENKPVIWRGPMVMGAVKQMLEDVAWGELDVLVVDMPPGTGDAQLTLAQTVPLSGAVIVSTPQDIALIDARKGIKMFEKVDVPILGIIENMSTFVCPNCTHESHIFGNGGAKQESDTMNVPFLGGVPLNIDIRVTSDKGLPIVVTKPDSPSAKIYMDIAHKIADALAEEQSDSPVIQFS